MHETTWIFALLRGKTRNTTFYSNKLRPFIINYAFIIKTMTKNEMWDAAIIWLHYFFISMVYFLLSLSMLAKKLFSVSKYAEYMLAYRKGTLCCFMQQVTSLHEHGSKCCRMEMFNELTCQKYMKKFEACCIFSQKILLLVVSIFVSLKVYFAKFLSF